MTPAGRPPRTNSKATKTVTIRLTEAERALLDDAASPEYTSEWLRDIALAAAKEKIGIVEPVIVSPETEAVGATITEMFLKEFESKLDERKRALLGPLMRPLLEALQSYANDADRRAVASEQGRVALEKMNQFLEHRIAQLEARLRSK
jgi:hypothetical protein